MNGGEGAPFHLENEHHNKQKHRLEFHYYDYQFVYSKHTHKFVVARPVHPPLANAFFIPLWAPTLRLCVSRGSGLLEEERRREARKVE